MNKQEFLAAVRARIEYLPQADRDRSLDYYAEMIDDRMEDGLSEKEAVAAMGPVAEIAAQITGDTPAPPVSAPRRWRVWEVLLLVLGSPVWLPLLASALVIVLSLYIVLWSVVVVLYAAELCLAAGTLVGLYGAVMLAVLNNAPQAVLFGGAGLVSAGAAILFWFVCGLATKGAVWLSRWGVAGLVSLFKRKEESV